MRGRKVQGSGGVAEFTKMWQNLQKLHPRAFCSCTDEKYFVCLTYLFQSKTEDSVQNDDTMMKTKTIKTPRMMAEEKRKRNTIVCPNCGQDTSFNIMSDAIDEEGEFYRCQHCGWPFHYKVAI